MNNNCMDSNAKRFTRMNENISKSRKAKSRPYYVLQNTFVTFSGFKCEQCDYTI